METYKSTTTTAEELAKKGQSQRRDVFKKSEEERVEGVAQSYQKEAQTSSEIERLQAKLARIKNEKERREIYARLAKLVGERKALIRQRKKGAEMLTAADLEERKKEIYGDKVEYSSTGEIYNAGETHVGEGEFEYRITPDGKTVSKEDGKKLTDEMKSLKKRAKELEKEESYDEEDAADSVDGSEKDDPKVSEPSPAPVEPGTPATDPGAPNPTEPGTPPTAPGTSTPGAPWESPSWFTSAEYKKAIADGYDLTTPEGRQKYIDSLGLEYHRSQEMINDLGLDKRAEEREARKEELDRVIEEARLAYVKKDYKTTSVWSRLKGIFGKHLTTDQQNIQQTEFEYGQYQEAVKAKLAFEIEGLQEDLASGKVDDARLEQEMDRLRRAYNQGERADLYDARTKARVAVWEEKWGRPAGWLLKGASKFTDLCLSGLNRYRKIGFKKKFGIGAALAGIGLVSGTGVALGAARRALGSASMGVGVAAMMESHRRNYEGKKREREQEKIKNYVEAAAKTPEEKLNLLNSILGAEMADFRTSMKEEMSSSDRRKAVGTGAAFASFFLLPGVSRAVMDKMGVSDSMGHIKDSLMKEYGEYFNQPGLDRPNWLDEKVDGGGGIPGGREGGYDPNPKGDLSGLREGGYDPNPKGDLSGLREGGYDSEPDVQSGTRYEYPPKGLGVGDFEKLESDLAGNDGKVPDGAAEGLMERHGGHFYEPLEKMEETGGIEPNTEVIPNPEPTPEGPTAIPAVNGEEVADRKLNSIWKMVDKQLQLRYGAEYTSLDAARRTYIIDHFKDQVAKDPGRFGLKDADELAMGQKVNLSSLFENKTHNSVVFDRAEDLTPKELKNINQNNAKILRYLKTHPGDFLSSEQVDEILTNKPSAGGKGSRIIDHLNNQKTVRASDLPRNDHIPDPLDSRSHGPNTAHTIENSSSLRQTGRIEEMTKVRKGVAIRDLGPVEKGSIAGNLQEVIPVDNSGREFRVLTSAEETAQTAKGQVRLIEKKPTGGVSGFFKGVGEMVGSVYEDIGLKKEISPMLRDLSQTPDKLLEGTNKKLEPTVSRYLEKFYQGQGYGLKESHQMAGSLIKKVPLREVGLMGAISLGTLLSLEAGRRMKNRLKGRREERKKVQELLALNWLEQDKILEKLFGSAEEKITSLKSFYQEQRNLKMFLREASEKNKARQAAGEEKIISSDDLVKIGEQIAVAENNFAGAFREAYARLAKECFGTENNKLSDLSQFEAKKYLKKKKDEKIGQLYVVARAILGKEVEPKKGEKMDEWADRVLRKLIKTRAEQTQLEETDWKLAV